MKIFVRPLALLIVAILLFSSITVVFFPQIFEKNEGKEEIQDKPADEEDAKEENEEPEEQNNDTEEDINEDVSRFVFIEEGTFTNCKFCPDVTEIIHEIYESQEYPIYYVSLVKENERSEDILTDDYNIYAYPTVFIDGGYRVVMGKKDKEVYETRITEAYNRDRTNLIVNITAEYNSNESNTIISGFVKNIDNQSYTGSLDIYLTEKISTDYRDDKGNAYHFSFIDYVLQENIVLTSNEQKQFSKNFDSTSYDPENLKLFAVVSNSDSNNAYSDPDSDGGEEEHSFNAHYVNTVASADVVEGGNTPPAVGINLPTEGMIHFRGKTLFDFKLRNTFAIGKTNVKVRAEDDGTIEKVEFYIDDELIDTDEESEYEFEIKKIGMFRNIVRKHTIKVVAYDDTGKTAEDEMQLIAIFL